MGIRHAQTSTMARPTDTRDGHQGHRMGLDGHSRMHHAKEPSLSTVCVQEFPSHVLYFRLMAIEMGRVRGQAVDEDSPACP